jgi:hypothetical protein
MEPEVSLPCSQEPIIEPYPKPRESSQHPTPWLLRPGAESSLMIFRPKFCVHFSSLPWVLHAPPLNLLNVGVSK